MHALTKKITLWTYPQPIQHIPVIIPPTTQLRLRLQDPGLHRIRNCARARCSVYARDTPNLLGTPGKIGQHASLHFDPPESWDGNPDTILTITYYNHWLPTCIVIHLNRGMVILMLYWLSNCLRCEWESCHQNASERTASDANSWPQN